MKKLCKKSIVISIILLFVGVSASSAVSVDTKSTISNNQNEECRECNEISDADLVKVERLLNRVEVYSKLLLVLSRHNPELREICEELSNGITTLKESLKNDGYSIICVLIWAIVAPPLYLITDIIYRIDQLLGGEGVIELLLLLLFVSPIYIPIIELGERLDCWWVEPWYPLL